MYNINKFPISEQSVLLSRYVLKFTSNYYFRVNFENYTAFSLVVVGNVPMPGPIIISYPDAGGNTTSGNGTRTMLVHWNPGK